MYVQPSSGKGRQSGKSPGRPAASGTSAHVDFWQTSQCCLQPLPADKKNINLFVESARAPARSAAAAEQMYLTSKDNATTSISYPGISLASSPTQHHQRRALSARSFAAYKSWIEMYWFGGWPRDVSTRRKQLESVHRWADPKCVAAPATWKSRRSLTTSRSKLKLWPSGGKVGSLGGAP